MCVCVCVCVCAGGGGGAGLAQQLCNGMPWVRYPVRTV